MPSGTDPHASGGETPAPSHVYRAGSVPPGSKAVLDSAIGAMAVVWPGAVVVTSGGALAPAAGGRSVRPS